MGLLSKLFPLPSKKKFGQRLMRAIRQAGYAQPMTFDAGEFKINFSDSNSFNLGNVYEEFRTTPFGQRRAVLERYARFAMTTTSPLDDPETFAAAKPNLLPKIRERFYHQALGLRIEADGKKWPPCPLRVVGDLLTLELVYDMPDGMRTIDGDSLSKWGVSFDQAMEAARENLWKKSNEDFFVVQPGLYVSPWRDNYDACRLALHDLIWQLKVNGHHVAAVPHRDVLIVTGSEDVDGLVKMMALVEEARQMPRFMLGSMFRLEGSQWQSFMPPAGHPVHLMAIESHTRDLARDYSEQSNLLKELHEKTGEDVFVASLMVFQNKESGAITTRTVWLDGIQSLIPKSDEIVFGIQRPGEQEPTTLGAARWDRVAAVAGDLLAPTEHYPPRFRVGNIPSKEQLESVGLIGISQI